MGPEFDAAPARADETCGILELEAAADKGVALSALARAGEVVWLVVPDVEEVPDVSGDMFCNVWLIEIN